MELNQIVNQYYLEKEGFEIFAQDNTQDKYKRIYKNKYANDYVMTEQVRSIIEKVTDKWSLPNYIINEDIR